MAGQHPDTCGVDPTQPLWKQFIYKNQFELHFGPQLQQIKLDVKTLQSNIDDAIGANQLSPKETKFWNDQLAKYNIWIRKFERTFTKQRPIKQSRLLRSDKLLLETAFDGEIGWYQVKGQKPLLAHETRANWIGLCDVYKYVVKSIRKDRQNFSMRQCGKKSRSDCAAPCHYTTASGCHFNIASVKPAYSLQ